LRNEAGGNEANGFFGKEGTFLVIRADGALAMHRSWLEV
jgi:hypothetical protein